MLHLNLRTIGLSDCGREIIINSRAQFDHAKTPLRAFFSFHAFWPLFRSLLLVPDTHIYSLSAPDPLQSQVACGNSILHCARVIVDGCCRCVVFLSARTVPMQPGRPLVALLRCPRFPFPQSLRVCLPQSSRHSLAGQRPPCCHGRFARAAGSSAFHCTFSGLRASLPLQFPPTTHHQETPAS